MIIVDLVPETTGWRPVKSMIQLAAELFEAELLRLQEHRPSAFRRLGAVLSRRRARTEGPACLLICSSPTDLLSLLEVPGWRRRFRCVAAWIIDSFWVNWIPSSLALSRPFDRLFITSEEDLPAWTAAMKTRTTWLPWGSDVLRLGGGDPQRGIDLVRVGRQPLEWDDDAATEQACATRQLRFHGRLPEPADLSDNQRLLMQLYRRSKFLLAFSNTVSPADYTHPTRQYLTARWVDGLACGAVIAGIAPREPSIERLLWPGATLELGSTRREPGLDLIAEGVRRWRPEQAEHNHRLALQRLDWRWRFAELADALEESPSRLAAELQLLRAAAGQPAPAVPGRSAGGSG